MICIALTAALLWREATLTHGTASALTGLASAVVLFVSLVYCATFYFWDLSRTWVAVVFG